MLLTRVTPAPTETPSANEFFPGASLPAAIVAPKLAEVFGGNARIPQERFQFSGGGKQAQDPFVQTRGRRNRCRQVNVTDLRAAQQMEQEPGAKQQSLITDGLVRVNAALLQKLGIFLLNHLSFFHPTAVF